MKKDCDLSFKLVFEDYALRLKFDVNFKCLLRMSSCSILDRTSPQKTYVANSYKHSIFVLNTRHLRYLQQDEIGTFQQHVHIKFSWKLLQKEVSHANL